MNRASSREQKNKRNCQSHTIVGGICTMSSNPSPCRSVALQAVSSGLASDALNGVSSNLTVDVLALKTSVGCNCDVILSKREARLKSEAWPSTRG